MKKLFSSIFIVLILLNVMGYYGLFVGLQYKNTVDMIHQLDLNSYNPDEAHTIKIPFKSPNGFYSEVFERVDGDFQRDGEVYRLVKQRLFRDTFHIVYIKDKTATAINKALSDYVKTFSNESSDNNTQTTIIQQFIKEYFFQPFEMQHLSTGWEQKVRKESHAETFSDSFSTSIIHPPERVV